MCTNEKYLAAAANESIYAMTGHGMRPRGTGARRAKKIAVRALIVVAGILAYALVFKLSAGL